MPWRLYAAAAHTLPIQAVAVRARHNVLFCVATYVAQYAIAIKTQGSNCVGAMRNSLASSQSK